MMGLTSNEFVVTLAVALGLAMVVTLLLWTRARGPAWAKLIQRLGMLIVCQLLAIGLVGTWVNNYYGLYYSWDSLISTAAGDTYGVVAPPLRHAKFTDVGSGLRRTHFRGPRSRLAGEVYVWLPPQYHQPAYRHTAFPVVMLLHGVPGNPESWTNGLQTPSQVADYIARGILHPVILVIPTVDPEGIDTDCSNTSRGQVATWLTQDVPHDVRRHFRVQAAPRAWALLGLSTGGLCALKLPMQYPNVFAIGAGMSPDPVRGDPSVLTDRTVRIANSPVHLAARRPNVRLWAGTGAQDRFSPPSNITALRRVIRPPTTLAPTVVVPQGGHNPFTWGQLEPKAFTWINSVQASPAPMARTSSSKNRR